MEAVLEAAADLLLGARCPGCGTPGRRLCADCRAALARAPVDFVTRDPCPPGYPVTAAGAEYDARLRALVTAFKEHQVRSAGAPLGERVGLALARLLAERAAPGTMLLLVPVPSAPSVVRRRGLDCTAVLAQLAAREVRRRVGLRLPVRRVLRHRARVRDQAGLDAQARWTNLTGALSANRWSSAGGGAERPVLAVIVDDVTTTGATLAEARRALLAAGLPVLGAAVAAATVRRSAPARR